MIEPEKICPLNNEENIKNGLTWQQSDDFRAIFNMIFESGAFGSNVNKRGGIADQVYLNAEPQKPKRKYEDNQDRGSTRSKNSDWTTKGRNRIGNIISKKRSLTKAEADHFFFYFLKFAGPHWADAITSQDLISKPLIDIIDKGKECGLEWPINISGYHLFRSELGAHSNNSEFEVCFSEPLTKDIGTDVDEHKLKPLFPIQVYMPHTEVQIHLKNIGNTEQKVFFFLTYDQEYHSGKEDYDSSVRFIQSQHTTNNEMRIDPLEGGTYKIQNNKGLFCLYALAASKSFSFFDCFGFNIFDGEFISDQNASILAKRLKLMMIENTKNVKIATHPYRV